MQPKNIIAEIIGDKIWIKNEEHIWCYPIADLTAEGQRRKKSNSSLPNKIIAPMPGKVTKIFVKNGDVVIQGQPLLVMEAMKMEYTLKSDLNTEVVAVNADLQQQVSLGYLLVELKEKS